MMKKVVLMLIVAFNATGVSLYAQAVTKSRPAAPHAAAATDPAARGDDEKAIRVLLDAFTKAFDAGDAAAAAATYSENGIVVDEQGERTEGRAAIRDQYARSFADNPGSTITIKVDSLRLLGPETAIEEGRTTIKPAAGAGAPDVSRFVAVYVKQGGQWRQAVVRDEIARDLTPHDRLKELEWLVGDWVNESQDAVVSTTCAWAVGGNFLDREFTMKTEGRPVLTGTQRIGWDPLKQQFKTWIFDSEGGHGEGYFTRIGDEWVIKVEGVRQDGQPASSTNVVRRLGKDRISWQSVQRTLGGSAIPGVDEFVIVRKPPQVGK
ncbi:MAG: SgcJ/EcaC family oxidoreductase [Paludisphaera borealis]|uniref:YybH family protein n=1 Tax=Paludisphaera borealis TaxID=1387353 RepID=UPI0028489422|nr:SgcJ/EcaC family oxidoreductase [Paludisphaera borealis]MDR3623397.1 SgcJ/EcaC family oxidoreductase [Paludisphaera borealis]